MSVPVIDFHCDLLAYLQAGLKTCSPLDPMSNCSIPLLEKGNVRLQILALWSETTNHSHQRYREQLDAYYRMLRDFPERVSPVTRYQRNGKHVHFVLAIENASCLLEEDEPFELFVKRIENLDEPVLYVSLTWNEENRFGGGNLTKVGLKREGEIALEILAEKRIAIDMSHTSDALADGILNFIHGKGLRLQPIASHSNFRSIVNCARNLPDAIAREIADMKGVIGINFVRVFIGKEDTDFLAHIQHGIDIVGEDALVLGSDFFGGIAVPTIAEFFPYYLSFSNSACFPQFFRFLEKELSSRQIEKIAYKNAEKLLARQGLIINEEVKNETLIP